ncbi:STAS domain-containing protein [Salimicrobium jeotgali]|nr:STAS domain-containing protein [Salimicrobium jeotgali]
MAAEREGGTQAMKRVEATFPLPYYEIDAAWNIIAYSQEAEGLFGLPDNLTKIVDEGTYDKAREWVNFHRRKTVIEMNVIKENSDVILADVYITWTDEEKAELLLIPKDSQVDKVAASLKTLQSELLKTKTELIEEKERAEQVIEQNNKLSAPFISLNKETALVPLFGDLSYDKIMSVEHNLLEAVRESEAEELLFDFTAVGNIEREGFNYLASVLKALSHIGVELFVIGLKPGHVPNIFKWSLPEGVRFRQSLEQVISSKRSRREAEKDKQKET